MLSFFSFWLGTGTGMWPPRLVAPPTARRIVSSTLRKTAKRQSTAIVTAREKVYDAVTGTAASADQKVVECVEWDVDPISRERLKSDACDAIRIGQNIFHLPTLVTYLDKYDGVRLDPVSRTALTQQELELINARASALGIEVQLSDVADELSCQRRRSHSDEILTLECLLGEVVSELREMIGDDMDTPAAPNSWVSVLPYGIGGFDNDTIFRFTVSIRRFVVLFFSSSFASLTSILPLTSHLPVPLDALLEVR